MLARGEEKVGTEEEPTMTLGIGREFRWFDEDVAPPSMGDREHLQDEDTEEMSDWFYEDQSPAGATPVNLAPLLNVPIPEPLTIDVSDGESVAIEKPLEKASAKQGREEGRPLL